MAASKVVAIFGELMVIVVDTMMIMIIMMMTMVITLMTLTILIFEGGTGKTGKFGVKGALQRGHNVRLLARNPDKVGRSFFCFKFPLHWVSLRNLVYSLIVLFQVKKVFNDIFGEEEGPVQFEKVFNSQCNQ